ncbi:MAG TPA: PKD domain-containing protein [Kofleriaceae bacterium]|nr:PKD domain-containing protein [Kofleriaceae bacterium]
MTKKLVLVLGLAWPCACDPSGDLGGAQQAAIGSPADPAPGVTFTQVGLSAGIDRSREPATAGPFNGSNTEAYGAWLADLDGDGRLDYYAVNHGQSPHSSGLFLNTGTGGFGPNLFTVGLQPSGVDPPNLGNSNEMRFVGDLNGDGLVDFFFLGWSGFGTLCINQGVAQHADWTGPSFTCYGTADGLAFADVNGDGKIDVLSLDIAGFDTYTAYYAQTASYVWRLNNGDPDINHWPTTRDFAALRPTDPSAWAAAPFVDLDNDGIPDKIVGIPGAEGNRGGYGTSPLGQQVFLGRPDGTYALQAATGLESVTQPITRIEDINGDGCLDIGTDLTGYRDNQSWYVQNKTGSICTATFTATPRTALPFFPGFKHYSVDIDNSGLLSQAVVIHAGYGNNDGRPGGVSLYRKLPDGGYTAITPTQSGIDLNEFYADNLSPGDWNDDGKLDLGGSGNPCSGSDSGFGLWTSNLATTNRWIKVTLPTVTGFFAGAATIEVFDAGFAGDPAHLVTPPRQLTTGRAWASQVYHFGIGTRSAVDVRVTFPDGRQVVRSAVAPASRIAIQPISNAPPVAVASAQPTAVAIGEAVAFDGSASSDPDGSVVAYRWDFGDGAQATAATASHAYAAAGAYVATLTVTDDAGSTATSALTISVADTVAPAIAITGAVFTPAVSDNVGVVKVEWRFDGALVATATAAPFSYALDLTPGAGPHTLVARAFDAAGNTTDSAPIAIQP